VSKSELDELSLWFGSGKQREGARAKVEAEAWVEAEVEVEAWVVAEVEAEAWVVAEAEA